MLGKDICKYCNFTFNRELNTKQSYPIASLSYMHDQHRHLHLHHIHHQLSSINGKTGIFTTKIMIKSLKKWLARPSLFLGSIPDDDYDDSQ